MSTGQPNDDRRESERKQIRAPWWRIFGLANIVQRAKRSDLFIVVSGTLVLLTCVITIANGGAILVGWYKSTWARESELYAEIKKLSAGVNIGYFEQILGKPAFITRLAKRTTPVGVDFPVVLSRQYIFVKPEFYVQALTDPDGSVLAYAVTTRRRDFNPSIVPPGFGEGESPVTITLAKSTFADIDQQSGGGGPDKIVNQFFWNTFYYCEGYYLGNPGNYQSFVFAFNEAGYMNDEYPPDLLDNTPESTEAEIAAFRDRALINTFAVTAPNVEWDQIVLDGKEFYVGFGPNNNRVRVLDEGDTFSNYPGLLSEEDTHASANVSAMNGDQTFRLILILGFVLLVPFGVYHRVKSLTREKLDRRQEGVPILVSLRLLGSMGMAGLLAFMIEPAWMAWSSLPLPVWVRWLGVGLGFLGAVLLIWTFRHLGKNLTDTVVTRKEHTLVTTGPYRYVRHPFYVFVAVSVLANSLAAANWFLFATGGAVLLLLVVRSRIEEEKLIERFGDEYEEYMRRTGKFFPRLKAGN